MPVIIFLAHFLVVQPSASAAEASFTCSKSAECVVDEHQCYSPLAINKKFLKQNQLNNEKDRPLIQCLKYKGPPKEKYRAICKKMKCALELK